MTIQVNGADIGEAIEIAMAIGGIVSMLVIGLLIYLMVRPPRRRAEPPPRDDAMEIETALASMERMERRLEALERAVEREARAGPRLLETGAEGAETRRTR